jgi:predicted RNA-binding Zn ribbon-like protein
MVISDSRFQHVADGLLLPAFVAGHPVLDFCNTRAGWGEPEPREYLTSYDHLVVWAREAGFLEPGVATRLRRADGGDEVLARALELRGAIYAACTAADDGAWDVVAAEAQRAAGAARLTRGAGWVIPEEVGAELPLLEVARAAGTLLSSDDLTKVGRCPGHGCGWLFVDPRGRRRWCVMAVCGNREKARRHARKVRA